MADLKVGTTIGGSPVWHQGNLALVPSGNAILYKGARIYSENDKPSANELQVVSRAGDTMTGMLNVETSTEYPLALKSSVSGPAYIRFSKGNTLQSYVGTDAAGDFKVAMTDVNGSWAFDGLKIAKSNGNVSLRGALVSTNAGNFDIKYGNVQFIRANSSKHLYIGAPGGTDLVLGYAQDGMTTTKIRFDSAVYNKTGGLLINAAGLIQRSAMDNPYYNQTESDARFIRLNVNTATNGYLLSKSVNIGDANNLNMGYSGFFRHGGLDGFRGLTINVSHPEQSNGAHSRGITFDYGSAGYGMYTYAYDSAGNKLANQKIYTEADKPTPAEIGALAAGANAVSASKLQTARTISLTGGATGSVSFDGSANASLAVTITNDSHTHSDYVKKIGDSMSGNLTVPKVLLSAAQGTEANSVARRDFVESTVTASGKGVKDLTIALPAGAPTTGYIPVLFKTYGTSNSFVFIDTSGYTEIPMNNCSFLGNVRASGWSDRGSYAVGQFTIFDGSERAIHSIHGPAEADNGFVVYVETRAFPIRVRVDIETDVTAYATDVTYGTSVFKVDGQVSGNTKTFVLANFDKGTGTYRRSNRVYDNGYNPTPEAVGALPVNGNAVTASRLQTARLIAGVPFDGTSNISISATNVGALPITGGTLTGNLTVPLVSVTGSTISMSSDSWDSELPIAGFKRTHGGIDNAIFTGLSVGWQGSTAYGANMAFRNNSMKIRTKENDVWGVWNDVYHTGNKPSLGSDLGLQWQLPNPGGTSRYVRLVTLGLTDNDITFVLAGFGDHGTTKRATYNVTAATRGSGISVDVNVLDADLLYSAKPIIYHRRVDNSFEVWLKTPNYNLDATFTRMSGRGGVVNIDSSTTTEPTGLTAATIHQIYTTRFKPTPGDVGAVNKAGDTMTGNLTAPKVLVSGEQGTEVNALTRKDYVDTELAKKLNLTGGTMTGPLVGPSFTARNTNNVSASVNLTFMNDIPALRYGGSGVGAASGFIVAGAGDSVKFKIDESGELFAKGTAKVFHTDNLPTLAALGAVSKTGDTMTGSLTAPKVLVSGEQGTEVNALTRKDYVDGQVATRAPMAHTHTVAAITDLKPQDANATANTLALRDSETDVHARLFRATYGDVSWMSGAIAFRINNSTNNYTRYCSNPAAVRDWMKGAKTNWDMHWRAYIEHADAPMTEYHIPGKAAVLTYLGGDGVYSIASSNGAGGATSARMWLDPSGNMFTNGGIYEAGQRVYSPHNPPPLTQSGHGQGGTSVTFSTVGKTMAIAYLAANSRVYPVTFAIASAVQHGVNVPNRGGESADRDYDLRVAVSVSGNNMTLTTIAGNRCNGIWQVYTM
ncbi:tail fiber protein [Aeromonas phage Aes012]|uniref:Small distal tail fiber subunit n=1 Tax=Aeromonas phage Aes012 TaxID=1198014 RepID=I6YY04_9CAUD|nr:tail fiber protein [Aeromonas phage Aes012]AFN69844.1 small distal tail fiber subunit [Aeromonas phage Aes012]